MKRILPTLILVIICYWSASAQVTSYNFDPSKINQALAQKLDSLYQEDQKYRMEASKAGQAGASSQTLDSLKNIIRLKDNSNLELAIQLIDKHGWLGPEQVGFQGTQALFLIIQHADLKTQQKYYPLILQAEKEGKILSSNVAILEDRIAVREGKAQTYGSQGYYDGTKKKTFTYPLKDLQNLDQLRKSRGLQPMKEYLKDWSEEAYQTNLPYATELLNRLKVANKS